MKNRIIIIVTAAFLVLGIFGIAQAVKPRADLATSRLQVVVLQVEWNEAGDQVEEIIVQGQSLVFDADGNAAGEYGYQEAYSSLPQNEKNIVRNFLRRMGKAINNAAVNEDVEPNIP